MKIVMYGSADDKKEIRSLLEQNPDFRFRTIFLDDFDDYDKYLDALYHNSYDAVFVSKIGADGMEAITAAKTIAANIPRVWISDDEKFGPQSFRLDTAFFTTSPMNQEKLIMALKRCEFY